MKIIFTLCLLLLFVPVISAQTIDKTVEKIRTYYTGVSEKATAAETDDDQGQYGELFVNELSVNKRNHQWRAVGIYQPTYRFFYKTMGETMYPESLVMVKTERRVSDRTYREEYLFSETGALLFYFQKAENDDQAPAERRVYFNLGKAVRVVEDGKTRDKLTVADIGIGKDVWNESVKIRTVFMNSIKL